MNDRELLELAAKAAGYVECKYFGFVEGVEWWQVFDGQRWLNWNPRDNDGDALRLAVTLKITLDFRGISERVPSLVYANLPKTRLWFRKDGPHWVSVEYVPEEMWTSGVKEDVKFANWYMQDQPGMVRGLEAASRRAIVRASAAIQQAKEEA